MKTITAIGKTARTILYRFRNELRNNNVIGKPISTITNGESLKEIGDTAFDLMKIISGNQPFVSLNRYLSKEQKLKIEPLNTVCFPPP